MGRGLIILVLGVSLAEWVTPDTSIIDSILTALRIG